MKYKIGDMFQVSDNFGYYIIQDVFVFDRLSDGVYQYLHISKDLKINDPLKVISGLDFDRRVTNLQIKYVKNILV